MKFRWGFQWGKVMSGLVMMLIGGGISVVLYVGASRISIWAVILLLAGFGTMVSGLIGDEEVW